MNRHDSIIDFLKNLLEENFELEKYNKIIFYGKQPPYFFLRELEAYYKQKFSERVIFNNIDLNEKVETKIKNMFLFDSEIKIFDLYYFFYDKKMTFSEIEKRILLSENFFCYLDSYFMKDQKENEKIKYFNLDVDFSHSNLPILKNFFANKFDYHLEIIFKIYKTINLESIFSIMRYANLFRKIDWQDYIEENEEFLKIKNYTIFDLNNYFFEKNKLKFFDAWNQLKDSYPEDFWVPYFMEQLWLAYLFMLDISKGEKASTLSKNILYRKLSRSFMNEYYKKYNIEELKDYFYEFYLADQKIKELQIDILKYLNIFFEKIMIKK